MPYIEINSKLIIDLNVNCKTMKFLEENMENFWLGLGKEFFYMTQKAQSITEKNYDLE